MPKIDRPGWPLGNPAPPPEFRSVEALAAHLAACPPDILRAWIAHHAVDAFPKVRAQRWPLDSLAKQFRFAADIAGATMTSTVMPTDPQAHLPRFLRWEV